MHRTYTNQVGSGARWIWLTILILIADQATKYLAQHWLTAYTPLQVVPSFNLTLAYNKGAAFSFLDKASGWQVWIFGGLAISVSIGILIWLTRVSARQRFICIALTLILGGALGNLADRMLHGYVIDFLEFYVGSWYWPAFNVADSAICVGAFMLFIDAIFLNKK